MVEILDVRGLLSGSGEYPRRASPPSAVVVHHTATSPALTPLSIAAYHVYTRGYPGIAYHYCVAPTGTVWQCNDDDAISYHAGCMAVCGPNCPLNANAYSVGVALIGDFTREPPPAAQLAATRELVAHLRGLYGDLALIGHREAHAAATACPGDTFDSWRGALEGPMADGERERAKAARWHAEEAVREIERSIESLQAARKRLIEETIAKLYEVERQGT